MLWLFCFLLASLDLVRDGKSDYTIWLAPDAIPAERRAADELSNYIAEMTGAKLPVVAAAKPTGKLIRLEPLSGAGAEQFSWKQDGRDLVIAGGRPRGVLYGVYTLLDHWGCRWYTRDVSHIPKVRKLSLNALSDVLQGPAFEYREPFFFEAWEKNWAARNRTNGHFQELDASTGGRLRYQPFVHSFYDILPPKEHFATHPEYFSFIDGKRRWERGQLCLTNAAVLKLTVDRVRQWIRDNPEAMIVSVSQNDWEGWCECDNCRRVEQEEGGEHSGPMLRFVNAVAAEIEKSHPDRLIDTIAYWYTENPPLKVRPRPNVRIRLCPIGVCESHAYEKCPRSAYFMKNLRAWSKITNQLYIWHYNTNFAHYLLPFPDFDEFAADIPMYKRHGVVGLFMEGSYAKNGGGELAELRAWVMARQLWDPATNVDKAVTEFLDGVYGPAGKPMRAYYDLLQQQVRRPDGHIYIFTLPTYSPDFLPRAEQIFARAMQTANTEELRRRVDKQRLAIEYLKLLYARRHEVHGSQYAPRDVNLVKDQFQTLLARMRSFGITSIHEGRDLDYDIQDYGSTKAQPLSTLENEHLRVDVVPEMSGRIIRILDKKSGRNLLRNVDPGERPYPDVGGASAAAHADYQARQWLATWKLVSATPQAINMTGTVSNGLRISRTLRLNGPELITETVLENPTAEVIEAVLRVTAELDPANIDEARVSFTKRGGGEATRVLIRPEEQPTGSEVWSGDQLPAGSWGLESGNWRVRNMFDSTQIERAALAWTAKGSWRATFGLWSKPGKLKAGDALRITASYRLQP
jgi:hypothetical protein